ncbi:hypothetical protein Taro_049786 [Colocasia esculenta]|uniref:SET domain-containing protein n=1 Tax=Colocasia esculenta TaxID=4460 RepID=A0A843XBZ8_COLES|nr:hypothetical protein [Colocasia esculenta]
MGGGEGSKVEAFLRWVAEMGVSDSPSPAGPSQHSSDSCLGQSLLLSDFPDVGGRGLAAARELRRGERVLRVPKEALLTSESVLKDENLAACVKRHPHLSSSQILTVCLLAEVGKGRTSHWYLYLTQLPQSYNTLANFSPNEIKSLQVVHFTFLVEDAVCISEKIVSKVHSDWEEAVILMQEMGIKPQLQTFRSWLWASGTVSTRTLHVPWDEAGCLCPVGDFFNYASPEDELSSENSVAESSSAVHMYVDGARNMEDIDFSYHRLADGGYEDNEVAYCFYARKRYEKGEQVLLCYGTYTNLELLEHYGFLLNENPNDKAFIWLDPDIYTSSSWPKDLLYIQQDGRPSFALHSTLRLWATPHNLRRAVGHRAYSGLQLSVENEVSGMKWLAKRCQHMLHQLPTTVAGDCSIMDTIDKMLKCTSWEDCMDLLSNEGELKELLPLPVNNPREGDKGFQLPGKLKRSLERFRLAVHWRLVYKRVLVDCISYCAQSVDMLSS